LLDRAKEKEIIMALLAQFIGEDAVARMSDAEIERSCEILHAQMLKSALANPGERKEISKSVAKFALQVVRTANAKGVDVVKGLQDALKP
jgi:hypothetical protein